MYSLSREQPPRPSEPEVEAKKDEPAVDQFNHHILLTVRALNNMRSAFVVRGA